MREGPADPAPPETNIVFWTLEEPGLSAAALVAALGEREVAVGELGRHRIRAVTHFGITQQDIELAVEAIRQVIALPSRLAECRS